MLKSNNGRWLTHISHELVDRLRKFAAYSAGRSATDTAKCGFRCVFTQLGLGTVLKCAVALTAVGSLAAGCGNDSSAGGNPTQDTIGSDTTKDITFPDTVTDVAGFDIGGTKDTATPGDNVEPTDTEAVQIGSLIITEIMRNSEIVADNLGEWIEIYNPGDEPVDIGGWTLRDLSSDNHVIAKSVVVPPKSAVIIAANGQSAENGGLPEVAYVYGTGMVLGNGADAVILESPEGIVDSVVYGAETAGWPAAPGKAMALKNDLMSATDNDNPEAWCNAPLPYGNGDFGSPNEFNPDCDSLLESICDDEIDNDDDGSVDCADTDCKNAPACGKVKPGAVIFTEIMFNPKAVADAQGEWLEIYNTTDETIDLVGLILTSDKDSNHIITAAQPLLLPPKSHMALARNATASGISPAYEWVSGINLGNTTDSVTLLLGTTVIDTVAWSPEAGFPAPDGASIQLDPGATDAQKNDVGLYWCDSTEPAPNGDLGTPGAANTACPAIPECGDNHLDDNEECDDGNLEPGDGCEPDCTVTKGGCGDGEQNEGEECDDKNKLAGDGCGPTCELETPVEPGTVIITELLIDPTVVADNVGEFIELWNTTDQAVNVSGWRISDGKNDQFVISPAAQLWIEPHDYLVLGRSADTVVNGGIAVDVVYGTAISLVNSADSVIVSFAGSEVDRLDYTIPPFPNGKEASAQLDPAFYDAAQNDVPENWCQSNTVGTDLFTPGLVNHPCTPPEPVCGDGNVEGDEECDDNNDISGDGCEPDCTLTPVVTVCGDGKIEGDEECDDNNDIPGDGCEPDCTKTPVVYTAGMVIITEIMANPKAVTDEVGEWIEITNMSETTLDLSGWTLTGTGNEKHVIAAETLMVLPGSVVVLSRAAEDKNGGVKSAYVYTSVVLSNTADSVGLTAPDGTVVDVVAYDTAQGFPKTEGASAQLIPTAYDAALNDVATNWCHGKVVMITGDVGTPGLKNPACDATSVCGDDMCGDEEGCQSCAEDCGSCDPCVPTDQPGCGGCECESCVCDLDDFCCTVQWDELCVVSCIADCGEDTCTSDGCGPSVLTGCGGCECEACVCAGDPFCCDVQWDETCVDSCAACGQDCGSDGCFESGLAGCNGCECETCVCDEDPFCCDLAWDNACVETCIDCGQACDAGNMATGCEPLTTAGCDGCACQGCVCAADPFCCDTVWDALCVSVCLDCGQNCGSDGCSASNLPGCGGCACEVCVCSADPFCCETMWDEQCVTECINDCGGCGETDVEVGALVITEIMVDPVSVVDAWGEWFEVENVSENPVNMNLLWLEDTAGGVHQILSGSEPWILQPGERAVLAALENSGKNGGVEPDYVYGADIILLNLVTGTEAVGGISISSDAGLVDLAYYDVTFPNEPGAALSLDPSKTAAESNDLAENWCPAKSFYNDQDRGTPGGINTPCLVPEGCGNGELDVWEECDDGNLVVGDWCNSECMIEQPHPPKPSSVVITEIMRDPDKVADSVGEWFELRNVGSVVVDLSGVVLADDNGQKHTISAAAPLYMLPGERVVFAANGVWAENGGIPVDYVYGSGFDLANDNDSIRLIAEGGEVDSVVWDNAWPGQAGVAIQVDPTSENAEFNDNVGSWCLSVDVYGWGDLGSPQQPNPPCPEPPLVGPGDILFAEVMRNPETVPDLAGEWIELYNPTGVEKDINGLILADGDVDFHVIDNGGPLLVPPFGVVVLGRNGELAQNGGVKLDYVYKNFDIANTTDVLWLFGAYGNIDIVVVDSAFPKKGGAAMNLDGTKLDSQLNDLADSWCNAWLSIGNGDSGTPGILNPPCPDCGNGLLDAGEDCDNGLANSNTQPDACRLDCSLPGCGDGVTDTGEECDGGNNCSPTCKLKSAPPPVVGQVIITEIHQNPKATADAAGEWFEVYNPSSTPITLHGIVISDLGSDKHTINAPGLNLGPKSHAVLGISGNATQNGGVQVDYIYSGITLGNGVDSLILSYGTTTLDSVTWDNGITFPDPDGATMSLTPAAYDSFLNDSGKNWCEGTVPYGMGDLGTPGATNSVCPAAGVCGDGVKDDGEECDNGTDNSDTAKDACRTDCTLAHCGDNVVDSGEECDGEDSCQADCTWMVLPKLLPGDVIITEIMQNPAAVADTAGEWFEVYNTTAIPLDLNGITIRDDGTEKHVVTNGGPLWIAPGGYLVFGRNGNSANNGGVLVDYVMTGITLGNGDDEIILEASVEIDRVNYDGGPDFPNPTGASMALSADVYDATLNDDGASWCLGTTSFGAGDKGTPGTANGICENP
ncbi:MAG: lamin tail domain-containing protein [Myxococcales bacterium]|nr:lamin tail domain-containing protein [Myxococcales bacterium]